MACVGENTFAAYFDLRLSPAETERLFEHVDGCVGCGRLLVATAGAHQLVGDTQPMHDPPAPALSLGRYRIERILGVGGMGVVYLARDPELDRKVAIKLLRPDPRVPAEVLQARLTREAQATARLSHPNVIRIYEIGGHGDQVFVVMELIDGTTLGEWLREKPRSWREIVRVFIAAGHGLEAAHRAGIVHRDFKPDNVLVARDGRVCVTDFGLARVGETGGGDCRPANAVTVTYAGLLVGTPAYMAPEQLRGEATGASSDLFSFCVALFEALHGVRPYPGATLDELRVAFRAGRIAWPRRSVGPRAHRAALERGLAIEAAQRQPSMAELLAVLRVDPAIRRRRVVAAGLAVLIGAGGAVGYFELRGSVATSCAGGPERLAGIWDPARKAQIHRAFVATAVPDAETVWRTVERRLDDYAGRWAALRSPDLAVAQLHRAAALAERAHDSQLIARCWRSIVTALQIMGKLDEGLLWADYAEAATVRAADGPVHVARVAANRSLLLADAGRIDDALAEGKRVIALLADAPDRDTPQAHAARANVASMLHALGRLDESLQLHREALAFFEQAFGRDNPDTLIASGNVVADLNDLRRFDEALPLAEQLVALQENAVGPEHRSTALAVSYVAGAEYGLHRYDRARAHILRVIAIDDRNAIGGSAYVEALTLLGMTEHALGRPDAATSLARAIAVGETAGVGGLELAAARFELAQLESEPARATKLATDARDAYAAAIRPGSPSSFTRDRDEVEAWLAKRAGAASRR